MQIYRSSIEFILSDWTSKDSFILHLQNKTLMKISVKLEHFEKKPKENIKTAEYLWYIAFVDIYIILQLTFNAWYSLWELLHPDIQDK